MTETEMRLAALMLAIGLVAGWVLGYLHGSDRRP